MVHADASSFKDGLSKSQVYNQATEEASALFLGQRNWVCNLSNAASLLYHALKSLPTPSSAVNWAGFYVLYPDNENQLLLGPFQGHVACQSIALGKGVCGTAAAERKTLVVKDVDEFPGHIACDSKSKSEIVVPIIKGGKVVAIIDIDCAELDGFDIEDQRALERFAEVLGGSADFPVEQVSSQ